MAKREKKQSAGAPAWMVSFADLQQLLLVFFILLFSTSTTDSAKLQEVLSTFTGSKHILEKFTGDKVIEFDKKEQGKSDTVAEGEKDYDYRSNSEKKLDLLQKEVNQQQLSENIKNAQILENELKNKLNSEDKESAKEFDKKIEVTATTEGVVMRFKDGVLFEPGGVEVRNEAKELLNSLGETLEKEQKIRVEGHTDDVPTGSSIYKTNWELSTARAISVMNYLTDKKLIAPENCSVEGFSMYRPLVENSSAENRAKNRRVDIVLLNK